MGCGAAAGGTRGCVWERLMSAGSAGKDAFGTWERGSGRALQAPRGAISATRSCYQCHEELFAVIGGSVDRMFQTICLRGWR